MTSPEITDAAEFLARLGTDAAKWAEAFCSAYDRTADFTLTPTPGDNLHVWFCNMIEAGRSAGYSEATRDANTLSHRAALAAGRAEAVAAPAAQDDEDRCIACDKPFKPGDMVLNDVSGGSIHIECCGPDRESYVGPGDPFPKGYAWQPAPAAEAEPVAWMLRHKSDGNSWLYRSKKAAEAEQRPCHILTPLYAAPSPSQEATAEPVAWPNWFGWQTMDTAPKDGTRILAKLHREAIADMDGIRRKAFTEIREIWYREWRDPIFGGNMPWHAGDPFDSHDGMAPDHMGEGVPIAWMPLPGSALVSAPAAEAEPALRRRYHDQMAYAIDLQRIIEDLCHSRAIREPETSARHHYDMAVRFTEARHAAPSASQEALREALDLDKAVSTAALTWCGEKDRETFQSDVDYFKHNWRALPGLTAYVDRELGKRARAALAQSDAAGGE